MVPSSDGGGYFMVASDGGVFAFGDARFEGSCPGIGGCSGAAVAVVPDARATGTGSSPNRERVCLRRRSVPRWPGKPGLTGHLRRAHRRRTRVLGPAGRRRRLRLRGCRVPGGPGGLGGRPNRHPPYSRMRAAGDTGWRRPKVRCSPTAMPRTMAQWRGRISTDRSSPPPASDPSRLRRRTAKPRR